MKRREFVLAAAALAAAPAFPGHHDMKPATLKALIEAGERAALEALPALRAPFP